MKHLIITVIGRDQAGLVETLSDTIYQNNGNWLSSSLSKLAGQFAGILQVEVADQHIAALSKALSEIEALQVQIVEDESKTSPTTTLFNLLVTGNDRVGIVKDVTTKLKQLGVNINKLKTDSDSAPNWGYPIFTADFQLELPDGLSIEHVQEALESIADDLTIDIDNN
ncbi:MULTISPECIES: glycine cleavage system protein R [Photobacterium]|uniref:Glycine cleavage system transcriptional repressor n=1 Tax=Photobacterium ganghwense TaxID=320778 RepID=A0A0J1JZR4_9GAMM|nr:MULTISPECIES: ACT domain-containing protein [Photobacterium]KLV07702.1 amino acid-binding protein [Photobacterium ganghwense]MBV1842873.1 amino acid-binding protein [Photobacterium ganghwense]PSU11445.1 amino acid-binding protein [Photobacterium ganghwense]QSV13552.1 amino acid-binding protein [Photobacterium ganghwense]